MKEKHPQLILLGDYNIAHQEIDIHDPKGNKNSSGFQPAEREWMTQFYESGWVDTFRYQHPEPHQYTWWSQRGQAYAKNVGWRIDYQIATPEFGKSANKAGVYKKQRFSDHAPLMIEYDWAL